MKLRLLAPTLTAALFALILVPQSARASSASLYVSPASGPVTVGSIIPVQVRVNTGGDPVNAVQANLKFSASQLAYQNMDPTGSAFSLTAYMKADTGSVEMARAAGGGEPPVKGDFLFATVYFKAVTTAGTSSVAIAADSHVVRSTDSVDIMAGAAAASGPKAPATGAPKPTAYPTLDQAKAAVAALATPTPAGSNNSSAVTPAAGNQDTQTGTPAAQDTTKVLSWNSPYTLGGLAVLVGLVAVIVWAYRRSRKLTTATPAAPAAGGTNPSAYQKTPHGSVDSKTGVINSETVYPNSDDSNQS